MQLFIVLPAASLNAQGEDAEIAKLCASLPQIVAPLDYPNGYDGKLMKGVDDVLALAVEVAKTCT